MAGRVWDRFLSEQDRAHVAAKPTKRIGFGDKPALLLIDLYRWVFGDKPKPILDSIKEWPGSCGMAGWNAVPHIQKLLATAREIGIPIVHITGLSGAGVDEWSFRKDSTDPHKLTAGALERRKHKFDIVDEVAPIAGEAVLRKLSPSAFWGTPLVGHLNRLRIDTVITCGESTSGCVRASVVDGCTYRFRMIVVEECVFDRHEACHAINLFDMNQKYADVLPLAEVLQYLHEWGEKNRAGKQPSI